MAPDPLPYHAGRLANVGDQIHRLAAAEGGRVQYWILSDAPSFR